MREAGGTRSTRLAFSVGALVLAALAAGRAEAQCATAFSEIIDARGKAKCVASDQARTIELRMRQKRDLKVHQDGQYRIKSDQRELNRDLDRAQTIRANAQRAEHKKRQAEIK